MNSHPRKHEDDSVGDDLSEEVLDSIELTEEELVEVCRALTSEELIEVEKARAFRKALH